MSRSLTSQLIDNTHYDERTLLMLSYQISMQSRAGQDDQALCVWLYQIILKSQKITACLNALFSRRNDEHPDK